MGKKWEKSAKKKGKKVNFRPIKNKNKKKNKVALRISEKDLGGSGDWSEIHWSLLHSWVFVLFLLPFSLPHRPSYSFSQQQPSQSTTGMIRTPHKPIDPTRDSHTLRSPFSFSFLLVCLP
jgi:hypothetical protein